MISPSKFPKHDTTVGRRIISILRVLCGICSIIVAPVAAVRSSPRHLILLFSNKIDISIDQIPVIIMLPLLVSSFDNTVVNFSFLPSSQSLSSPLTPHPMR